MVEVDEDYIAQYRADVTNLDPIHKRIMANRRGEVYDKKMQIRLDQYRDEMLFQLAIKYDSNKSEIIRALIDGAVKEEEERYGGFEGTGPPSL